MGTADTGDVTAEPVEALAMRPSTRLNIVFAVIIVLVALYMLARSIMA